MKPNKIITALAVAAMTLPLASCADMFWGVGTDIGVDPDYNSPYYGYYDNSIWNNAIDGFYGPVWTAPPAYRPPYRPIWNGGNPGPAIPPASRPSNGANRPVTLPDYPDRNPEGVTGKPSAPATAPNGSQRPGNMGRPQRQ